MPEDWRKSNVSPVFKKGKKEDPGRHRPVSVILIHGNTMEQLILETISRHVNRKKIIRCTQHGFTKGKSCLSDLITFSNEMTAFTDKRRAVVIVCLDFCEDFDTVCHKILLEKLLKSGLHERCEVGWKVAERLGPNSGDQ